MKLIRRIIDGISDFLFGLKRTGFGNIIITFLLIITISTVGIYLIERKENASFKTTFDTLWYTIVTLSTVGYGDKTPITVGGRLLGILIILFGVAIMGAVTGKIASYLVERQLKEGRGMIDLSKLKNHLVICGWRPQLPQIINDILTVKPELKPSHIVLVNFADPQKIEDIRADRKLSKIKFIYGDYSDEAVLRRANIMEAKTVIIIADHTNPAATIHEIDSRTVMTVMIIENLTKEIYTSAELLDPKFERYLKLSYCDEIILSRAYSRIFLANAAAASGISQVVHKIVEVDSPTPLKVMPFPDRFIGKTFKDVADFFKTKGNYILIGLLENTGNIYMRKREALKEAQKTPDISKLVDNLQNVKRIKPNDPIINPGNEYHVKKHSKAIVIFAKTIKE
ncbi:MAG: NAD-binding protein [Spirochaetes bacterium]|nr:NAD-binding protein [Spirochaetota bacterium]